MQPTTDFSSWLDNLPETDIEVIWALYQTVLGSSIFPFVMAQRGKAILVKHVDNDDWLLLASEKSMNSFLKLLDEEYNDGYSDVEIAYAVNHHLYSGD